MSMLAERVLLNEFPVEERPRERMQAHGPEMLSNAELLAILLRTGSRGCSALGLAEQVLHRFGSLQSLIDADLQELVEMTGIGLAKAAQLKAAIELGRRVARTGPQVRPEFSEPSAAARYMMDRMRFLRKEHFVVLHLDAKNRLLGEEVVSVGSLTASIVHPREIFKTALKKSAASIICLHNHPSGDPAPSREDVEVTSRLVEAGQILGIDVLDHIIMGENSYFSMKEKGWI